MSGKGESSSTSQVGQKRALLIGLRYDQPQMLYTYDDCYAVEHFLKEKYNFNVKKHLDTRFNDDEDPLTNVTLEYEIRTFIEDTKSGDISILYVSGHGGHPESEKGPGLIAAVDYKVVEVDAIIESLKELPEDMKFLIIIDACFGANFLKTFNEKIILMLASQEMEEAKGSIWHGSHFTNVFLHYLERGPETTVEGTLDLIKNKLRNLGIDQTPRGLCDDVKRKLPISSMFKH